MKKIFRVFTHPVFLHIIFWGYNAVFLLFVSLASIPFLGELSRVSRSIPWNVALMAYLLVLTPLIAPLLGLLTRLRKEPKKLAALLFCVEIPLILLALLRIVFIRQMTPVLWFFFLSAVVSAAGILFSLFKEKTSSKIKQGLHTLSQ